ncbi:MAG: peroxiredoxin [Actinoplanes sp.]
MPVKVGSSAPDFTLKDQNNQEVRLAQFHGRKPVLLVFYPLTFTGTCQGELTEIQKNLDRFGDVQVLAASVDSVYAHKVWALDRGFDFPLLADFWPHGAVAQAYGVFDATTGVAGRGTFLIDAAGVIRFAELAGPGEARDQTRWHAAIAALTARVG